MDAKKVYQLVKAHLDNHNLKYNAKDEEMLIYLTIHGDDLPLHTLIRVVADREVLQILSPLPSKIPEDKRVEAAIAVSVANYGMVNGSFDYDFSDGEIRFRSTQSFRGAELSDATIEYMMGISLGTTDKYNDRFFMLGKGMMSLEQFMQAEGK